MIKKIKKDGRGSAMVFAIVLITNALVVVASVVFMSIMRFKTSEAISLTPEAFQKADSGLEYVLWQINHGGASEIEDMCDSFDSSSKKCTIETPEASAYFLDEDDNLLSSNDDVSSIDSIKVVGELEKGGTKVSRSLKASLFVNP